MTETVSPDDASPENAARPAPRTAEVTAYLAARMCHDFISPASAIVSGLDLLEDPSAQDMREDAMNLIASSARKLADMLSFTRVAFGASASAETFDVRDLEKLAQGVFAHMRAGLDWRQGPASVNKPAARALLNLAQMAGAALPMGGDVVVHTVEGDGVLDIRVEAKGARPRLRHEVIGGLRGEPHGEGLHGHWVQAYYVSQFVADAGGQVAVEPAEELIVFSARLPL